MAVLQFDRDFTPHYGEAIALADNVRRVTCNNPSPFTFYGTNSYIVGQVLVAAVFSAKRATEKSPVWH